MCPYNVTLVKKVRRAQGKMAQQLKALVPDLSLVPNTLIRQLIATSNSSSKGVHDSFWPPLVPAHVANTHTQIWALKKKALQVYRRAQMKLKHSE